MNLYSKDKFLILLRLVVISVCFTFTITIFAQQTTSLYVGQSAKIVAPNPPDSRGIINQVVFFSHHPSVTVWQNYGDLGCEAYVNSYFTDVAVIECEVYWYAVINGKQYGVYHFTTYFEITCKPVNITLSPSSMNLNVGESKRLSYTLRPTISPTPTVEMFSNDTRVATVNNGYVNAVGSGDCEIILINSAGPDATCYVHVDKVDPVSVILPDPGPIYIGQKLTLEPELSPSYAQTTYSWSSSNPDVATVNGYGVLTGISVGTTNIKVTTANNLSASCDVEVYKPIPASIEFNKTSLRLAVGATGTLTYNVLPSYAIYNVKWENDSPDIVSISNGCIEAKKPGKANITVTTDNGKKATCEVIVPPEPIAIYLQPEEIELVMGRSGMLDYTFKPANAATSKIRWEINDTNVARVDSMGIVKALRPGKATITATSRNGITGTCELTVPMPLYQLFVWTKAGIKTGYLSTDEPEFTVEDDIVHFCTKNITLNIHRDTLDKFTIEPVLPEHPKAITMSEDMHIGLGMTIQLSYTITPVDAQTSLTWFNDNPKVVSVTQDGIITAHRVGEANLMLQTSNGLRARTHITVPEPHLRFYVWMRDGEVHSYDLEERPEVTLGDPIFKLTTTNNTMEYDAANILRFTLEDETVVDVTTDISTPDKTNNIKFQTGTLHFTGCGHNSLVRIYDTTGKLVQSAQTDGDGNLSLSLSSLRAGVYIISTEKTTIKIQKK